MYSLLYSFSFIHLLSFIHHTYHMASAQHAPSSSNEVIHISKDAAMRILSDVREMIRFPLHDEGIYYLHDDEDILTGYAMLYGQPGTVYYGG